MIYECPSCLKTYFQPSCDKCESEDIDFMIPLDPAFYPDFQYTSKGFVKDLFGKRKQKAQLESLLDNVLTKYNAFLSPYFLNFAYFMVSENKEEQTDVAEYSKKELFKEVLLRKGFDELEHLPDLLDKLLSTTFFSASYSGFKREQKRYYSVDLKSTLRAWIEDSGVDFRWNMPMFLYCLWESGHLIEEVTFNIEAKQDINVPLVNSEDLQLVCSMAEIIYKDILICRLDTKLANFDPEQYITIHQVDAMDGFEFEDFLVQLYGALGYDVKETKKTGDQGADLFVERFGKRIVIQAKNYSSNVGNQAIQQVISAKSFYNCDDALVVTNSFYTKSAKTLANQVGVTLLDRHGLIEKLEEYNLYLIESDTNSTIEEPS